MDHKIYKLANHPYSNCFIYEDDNQITFVSYDTRIFNFRKEYQVWEVGKYRNYSPTTRRQVSWFLQEARSYGIPLWAVESAYEILDGKKYRGHDCEVMLLQNGNYTIQY